MNSVIGLVLLVGVAAGFAFKIAQIRGRRARARPFREAIEGDPVAFRVPVEVRVFGSAESRGSTALKRFGGMASVELVIGQQSWHLASRPEGLLGDEWYFSGRDTAMEAAESLVGDPFGEEWIVLTGSREGLHMRVAVSASSGLLEPWGWLLRAGVQATSMAPGS